MAMAIQGASYLFSILQHLLTDQPNTKRLRLTSLVESSLADWQVLAQSLAAYPVPITSLVLRAPQFVGAIDASGFGLGGFWLASPLGALPHPIAFRYQFPTFIQRQLITAANPSGTLTNSDFELTALIAGAVILASIQPLNHATIWCASDNTPAISWCTKGSTSSMAPNAYLLQWLAQLSREGQISYKPVSIPGSSNTLADFCSRSFSLSDMEFTTHPNTHFPIQPSWQIVTLPHEITSTMISSLSQKMLPWECVTPGPRLPVRIYGHTHRQAKADGYRTT